MGREHVPNIDLEHLADEGVEELLEGLGLLRDLVGLNKAQVKREANRA